MARLVLHFEGIEEVFTTLSDEVEELEGFLELITDGEGCVITLIDGTLLAIPSEPKGLRYATVKS